jgi:hypothetical protein
MTDETLDIECDITEAAYGRFWDATRPLTLTGGDCTVCDDEQYAALGETDLNDPALPLIIFRARDGKFFEVEINVSVRETTPEKREAEREYYRKMAARRTPAGGAA